MRSRYEINVIISTIIYDHCPGSFYYDREATKEKSNGGYRYKRSVWSTYTEAFKEAHFATFPPALVEPCILAGSKMGDFVLDPFFGSGTVGLVAKKLGRKYLGVEISSEYIAMAKKRIRIETQLTLETLLNNP